TATVSSSAPNQFVVRANGGFYFISTTVDFTPTIDANIFLSTTTGAYLTTGGAWTNSSDRNAKTSFQPVDGQTVLEQLAGLPIQTWSYRAEEAAIRHIGPTAQDFQAAFKVGADDLHISTIDADGVALAAIQGLHQLTQEQEAEIASLEARLAALEQQPAAAPNVSPGWLVAGGLGLLNLGVLIGRRWLRPGRRP
ncbi:MAG: tail fiber domain-containing protein, partial [Anaerolineales bacterium]|nr:tail fiber domain-containing protein [Anaerolineales bacterium]